MSLYTIKQITTETVDHNIVWEHKTPTLKRTEIYFSPIKSGILYLNGNARYTKYEGQMLDHGEIVWTSSFTHTDSNTVLQLNWSNGEPVEMLEDWQYLGRQALQAIEETLDGRAGCIPVFSRQLTLHDLWEE